MPATAAGQEKYVKRYTLAEGHDRSKCWEKSQPREELQKCNYHKSSFFRLPSADANKYAELFSTEKN